MIAWRRPARLRPLVAFALALLLAACAIDSPLADPVPDFIARVGALRGQVGVSAPGAFTPYMADGRPLAGGERIETGAGARALLRLGSTALRIGQRTDLRLGALDEPQVVIELDAGSIALRVVAAEWAQRLVVVTPEGRWSASRPGHYRFDRWGDTTRASAWEGEARFDSPAQTLRLDAGRRVELSFSAAGAPIDAAWGDPVADEFAEWVTRDARAEAEAAALRHVPPEVIGWEDLDAHGDWTAHPQWGSVWIPRDVGAGWAPYTDGRWTWSPPWGWVWLGGARWEFAPSHYGRWAQWRGRWVWIPGPRHEVPRFRPAPPEAGPPPRQQVPPPRPAPVPKPVPPTLPPTTQPPPPPPHGPPMRIHPVPFDGRPGPAAPATPPVPTPAPATPRPAAPAPAQPGSPAPAMPPAQPAPPRPVAEPPSPATPVQAPPKAAAPPAPTPASPPPRAGERRRPGGPPDAATDAPPKPPENTGLRGRTP